MTTVPKEAINELKSLFDDQNQIWTRYRLVGDENGKKLIKPCKRIINKNAKCENILKKKYKMNWGAKGKQLKHYQAAFIIQHECIPDQKLWNKEQQQFVYLRLSHICGYNNCVETQHMKEETTNLNQQRKICHSFIKKYERKIGELVIKEPTVTMDRICSDIMWF